MTTPTVPSYTWKVVSQAPSSGKDAAGVFGPGQTVTFQLQPSGSVGTVFVPRAQLNAEGVRGIVSAAASELAGVDNLSG